MSQSWEKGIRGGEKDRQTNRAEFIDPPAWLGVPNTLSVKRPEYINYYLYQLFEKLSHAVHILLDNLSIKVNKWETLKNKISSNLFQYLQERLLFTVFKKITACNCKNVSSLKHSNHFLNVNKGINLIHNSVTRSFNIFGFIIYAA